MGRRLVAPDTVLRAPPDGDPPRATRQPDSAGLAWQPSAGHPAAEHQLPRLPDVRAAESAPGDRQAASRPTNRLPVRRHVGRASGRHPTVRARHDDLAKRAHDVSADDGLPNDDHHTHRSWTQGCPVHGYVASRPGPRYRARGTTARWAL